MSDESEKPEGEIEGKSIYDIAGISMFETRVTRNNGYWVEFKVTFPKDTLSDNLVDKIQEGIKALEGSGIFRGQIFSYGEEINSGSKRVDMTKVFFQIRKSVDKSLCLKWLEKRKKLYKDKIGDMEDLPRVRESSICVYGTEPREMDVIPSAGGFLRETRKQ
jgi:hypothetical protein